MDRSLAAGMVGYLAQMMESPTVALKVSDSVVNLVLQRAFDSAVQWGRLMAVYWVEPKEAWMAVTLGRLRGA